MTTDLFGVIYKPFMKVNNNCQSYFLCLFFLMHGVENPKSLSLLTFLKKYILVSRLTLRAAAAAFDENLYSSLFLDLLPHYYIHMIVWMVSLCTTKQMASLALFSKTFL
ncbi:hypothetical protein ACJX0J_032390 [Zea mays]